MSASMNVSAASTVWSRFQTAYSLPLAQRCQEIEVLLNHCSNKDLSGMLPGLLDHIFGGGLEQGWGLDTITKVQQSVEFDSVMCLMSPDGALMRVVCNLQADPYLTYEFPFLDLPAPTRHMIEDGTLPMFYVNKLQFQSYSKPALALGAFELYIFHLAHALVSQQWRLKSFNWNNMTEVVYPYLLDKYLEYFLPLNKKSLPKFPQSRCAPVRSPMVQQSPTSVGQRQSAGSGTQTRLRSRLGLLKPHLMNVQKPHGQGSPVSEKLEGDIWWSETFVQILAEFWLSQNAVDMERGISSQNLESFLPSNNHVRLVRLFLKHIHYFINSAEPEMINAPYQMPESSTLDEFKRCLLPTVLQKKIYAFFKHGFERWPLDFSFRLMLETWLTYIQPWRYIELGQHKDADKVSDSWFGFIRDNFLFYAVIFHEFLQRAKRLHLTSIHNAYLVFRVAKVFTLTNLPQLLREVEKMMCNSAYKQIQDLGGSYIAPELSTVLRIQISELEKPDFRYVNLFGRETEQEVQMLIQQIQVTRATVKQSATETKSEKSGFASFFDLSSVFEDSSKGYGDLNPSDVKKLLTQLDQAERNLCYLFSIKPQDQSSVFASSPGRIHTSQARNQSSLCDRSMSQSIPGSPDCELTSSGPQLTPLGRYQLMIGLRKFDLGYQGDPDLQPVRSYENKVLVRLLHHLSAFFNKMFHREIVNLYNRNDIIGRMSKVYFAAPLLPSKAPTSPIRPEAVKSLRTPRLSLRFLGSYQTLLYLSVMYVFLWYSFGFGPVSYLFVLVLCALVYGLFRALTLKVEGRVL